MFVVHVWNEKKMYADVDKMRNKLFTLYSLYYLSKTKQLLCLPFVQITELLETIRILNLL